MFVDSLINMSEEEVLLKEKDIVGKFPNTYTFTKNIGEKLLKKHRENVPLVIIRPSIIGAAMIEPFPGWVDSISAATAVYLTGSIGLLRDLQCNPNFIGDQVPVDYCSHLIIAAAADSMDKNDIFIFHSASSSRNPITWWQTMRYFWRFIGINRIERRIAEPNLDLYNYNNTYKAAFYIKRELPARAFNFVSRVVGNKKLIKTSEKLKNAVDQCKKLVVFFTHFTKNEWIYNTYNMFQLKSRLSEEDNAIYRIDIIEIDWSKYFPIFVYGIMKFILKEEAEPPSSDRINIVNRAPRYFSDLSWVFSHGKKQKIHDHKMI